MEKKESNFSSSLSFIRQTPPPTPSHDQCKNLIQISISTLTFKQAMLIKWCFQNKRYHAQGRDLIEYSKNLGMGLEGVAANPLFQKFIFGPNSTLVWSYTSRHALLVFSVLKFNFRLLGIRSFLLFVFVFARFLRIEIQFSAFALFLSSTVVQAAKRDKKQICEKKT